MKKTAVRKHPPGSAAYVVAHAQWQAGRGRKPSHAFDGERNMRKALAEAQKIVRRELAERAHALSNEGPIGIVWAINEYPDRCVLEITPDENLARWHNYDAAEFPQREPAAYEQVHSALWLAEMLVEWLGEPHWFLLHLAELYIEPGADAAALAIQWRVKNTEAAEQFAKEDRKRIARIQKKADKLVARLPHLDFSDVYQPLMFMRHFASVMDRVGVTVDYETPYQVFVDHGFVPNAEAKEDADEKYSKALYADRERHARYLIGQGLAGLQSSWGIPPVMGHFVHEWLKLHEAAA